MGDDRRHHRATQVVFVEVPVAGPDYGKTTKPRPYPRQDRAPPWRPQRAIPSRSKSVATKRLLDRINEQDQTVRAFMANARRAAS